MKKLHTAMLSGITDKATIMKVLHRPRTSHNHTWLSLNGEYKVLIVRIDMLDADEKNYIIEVWRINADEPTIGYQYFDRHVGMPHENLRWLPEAAFMYPDRSAMMTDLCHFLDANVHNS